MTLKPPGPGQARVARALALLLAEIDTGPPTLARQRPAHARLRPPTVTVIAFVTTTDCRRSVPDPDHISC